MEHLQLVFKNSKKSDSATGIYALPSLEAANKFLVFKIVSLHPDRRSYLQRAFALAKDDAGRNLAGSGVVAVRVGKLKSLKNDGIHPGIHYI